MDKIPEEVTEHFEMMLIWKPFTYMDEKGQMTTRYIDPKELNGDNKGQDYD